MMVDFVLGGCSAVSAVLFTNPADVIKTRQQLHGELQSHKSDQRYSNVFQSIKSIVKAEGVCGLQKGLPSAIAFQFSMNSTRLGVYQTIDNRRWNRSRNGELNKLLCIFWGGFAGVCGATVGCPLYLIKTQMQAQSANAAYAVGYQHNHKSTMTALKSIFIESGTKGDFN